MGDKLSRLQSVTSKQVTLIDTESVRDTLIDLHNYAAMAIMLLDENNNDTKLNYRDTHELSPKIVPYQKFPNSNSDELQYSKIALHFMRNNRTKKNLSIRSQSLSPEKKVKEKKMVEYFKTRSKSLSDIKNTDSLH